MDKDTEKKERRSSCSGGKCGKGTDFCCRDCPDRYVCAEVCDGPEGGSIDGHCEWRV